MMIENLEVFFNDFALIAIKENGETIKVLFDNEHSGFLDVAEGRRTKILMPSVQAETLGHGDELTINNINYSVSSIQPIDDGLLSACYLRI